jgi:hypothetical protein
MNAEQNARLIELVNTVGIEYARDIVYKVWSSRSTDQADD